MKTPSPPKWISKLLDWYCREEYADEIQGDLLELYDHDLQKGKFLANVRYLVNAIQFLRIYNAKALKGQHYKTHSVMNGHYFKTAFRNFNRHRLFTLANLSGLAISMAISFMIFLHVDQELSYEKDFPKYDRIYRMATYRWAKSAPRQAEEFQKYFTEVKNTCRFVEGGNQVMVRVQGEEQSLIAKNVYATDSSVVEMFDLNILQGSESDALTRPNTAIVASSLAKVLFPDKNPVGKTILVNDGDALEITGVYQDLPRHSHIKADILTSMHAFYEYVPQEWIEWRTWMAMYTYVQIDSEEELSSVRARLPQFQEEYIDWQDSQEDWESFLAEGNGFEIMPIADIHLYSDRIQEMGPNSNGAYVYIFIVLAIFILIIACVNFINIFVTLSLNRVKEIGVRKVMGAQKSQLVQQFLSEAFLIVFGAGLIALGLCFFSLPYYNNMADLAISTSSLFSVKYLLALFTLCVVMGFLSGAYPSLKVSRFGITSALSPNRDVKSGIDVFRKGLIVFQFVLSLFIIISTGAIQQQMAFIQNKELGYNADHILSIQLYGDLKRQLLKQRDVVFNDLKSSPDILQAGLTSNLVGEQLSVESLRLEQASPDSWTRSNYLRTDENYLELMGIGLIKGRDFELKSDTTPVYIVNEKLAQYWENDDPVGEAALNHIRDNRGHVIGVVEDMHYYTLHQEIEPLVIKLEPQSADYLLVKLTGTNVPEAIQEIEGRLLALAPGTAIQYRFLDDNLHAFYSNEQNMAQIFFIFSGVAVIISIIGLLGLASIEVQRRTKEIGIRKVMGATSQNILTLLSLQFVTMTGIAILLAVPISYFAIQRWLESFVYHFSTDGWLFIIPTLLFMTMCLVTVYFQALKILRKNPADSLQYE